MNENARGIIRLLTYYRNAIWWIVSRTLLFVAALSLAGLIFMPKYVAKTTITLLPTRTELGYASARPEVLGSSPAQYLAQTHVETLLSRSLAESVARELKDKNGNGNGNGNGYGNGNGNGHGNGAKSPGMVATARKLVIQPAMDFAARLRNLAQTGRWEEPDALTRMVDAIRSRTKIRNVPGSFVFEVSFSWHNPEFAAKMANLLTRKYISMAQDNNREEMRVTREYLAERIAETRADMDKLAEKTEQYRVKWEIYTTSADIRLGMEELSKYTREYNEAQVGWEQLDSRITALQGLQTPQALAQVDAERIALKARKDALQRVMNEQVAKLGAIPAKESGLLDLYRERMIKEHALDELEDRLLDTKVAEAVQLSAVRVIDEAKPPLFPVAPLLLRNTVLGGVIGLILSLGYVMAMEGSRPKTRCAQDLGAHADALLGVVPMGGAVGMGSNGAQRRLFRGLTGELDRDAHERVMHRHIDHILTRIMDGGRGRIHAIVSLSGEEGKTFVTRELAARASLAGLRVLIVDGDMKNPGHEPRPGEPRGAGLGEVLVGESSARDAAHPAALANVSVIAAGAEPHGRWLLPDIRKQLLNLAAEYDLVLLDVAALRRDPASLLIVRLADEAICIVDAANSGFGDAAEAVSRLRDSGLNVRFVLNKVQFADDYLFRACAGEKVGATQTAHLAATEALPAGSRTTGDQHTRENKGIPAELRRVSGEIESVELLEFGFGGFTLVIDKLLPGSVVTVSFPLLGVTHEVSVGITWTRPVQEGSRTRYVHGFRFSEPSDKQVGAIVERIVLIDTYRRERQKTLGRDVSHEEAAKEMAARKPDDAKPGKTIAVEDDLHAVSRNC